MSNKPKNSNRIVEYVPNQAERSHISMVREAKKRGFKHSGSKAMSVLRSIYANR